MENLGKSRIGRRVSKLERKVAKQACAQKKLLAQMKQNNLVERVLKLERASATVRAFKA